MNLIESIDRLVQIWLTVSVESDRDTLKTFKKEVKNLTKNLDRIEKINIDDALHIRKSIPLLTDHKYRNFDWLWSILKTTDIIQRKFPEIFADANAHIVRDQLGFPSPEANEVLRFKVKLVGFSRHEWSFFHEFSRRVGDIRLPTLSFEGIAKLDSSLFYLDWIGGKIPKSVPYYLGLTTETMVPSIIPLAIISQLKIPSDDSKYDFGLTICSSTEISKDQLRAFRKQNPFFDYHPLSDFDIHFKVEKTKGESKSDREQKLKSISEILRMNVKESPSDIGWTMAFIRPLGFEFPPLMRGSIILRGSRPPVPEISEDYLPIKRNEYLLTVKDKFDEDNVDFGEGTINDLPILYGSTGVAYSHTIYSGIPLPTPSDQIVASECMSLIGFVENASLEQIEFFSESSVPFVKNELHVDNRYVVIIPVLLANTVDDDAKEWVKNTIKMPGISGWGLVVPTLLDLRKGEIYHCEKGGAVPQRNIGMFIKRYLETDEMKWSKVKVTAITSTSSTCPYCKAKYPIEEGVSEVICQNCLKTYFIESTE